MTAVHAAGFAPVFCGESELLILGSFPSVKSRAVSFYYGNPQNRFWKTVCGFFGEEIPGNTEGKREFLLRRKIALWDIVTECDIVGSADASIENVVLADVPGLLKQTNIRRIFCNGGKAFELFTKNYPQFLEMSEKLCSTSPANPRFSQREWFFALGRVFPS